MSDIVERLGEWSRFAAEQASRDWDEQPEIRDLFKLAFDASYEAADTITRLRAEVEASDLRLEVAARTAIHLTTELSTLRARALDVVGPFAAHVVPYDFAADAELVSLPVPAGAFRAARDLRNELTKETPNDQ